MDGLSAMQKRALEMCNLLMMRMRLRQTRVFHLKCTQDSVGFSNAVIFAVSEPIAR